MAQITITSPNPGYAGKIGLTQFAGGTATVDNTTAEGASAIAFARRQGWKVSGEANPPELTPANGKPYKRWTKPQLVEYLTNRKVQFPETATVPDLVKLVADAWPDKAQGGSAINKSAGQDSGSSIVLGGKPSSFDNAEVNAEYQQAVTPSGEFAEPTITTQPQGATVALGDDHTFTVVAVGVPAVTFEWQHKGTAEDAEFETIEDETEDSLALTGITAEQLGEYRVIVANTQAEAVSAPALLTDATAS